MARKLTEAKRVAILDAAAEVFSRKDFHQVLTDEIAAEAGVGKGTIYRYFRSKDDLYFATIVRGLDQLGKTLADPSPPKSPPRDRLERIAMDVMKFFWNRRPFYMLLQRDEKLLQNRASEVRKKRGELERVIQEAIERGIRGGEFREMDARVAANLFLGMIRSAVVYHRESETASAYVAQITDVFLRGVGKETE
jgi:TetR/AcrR family fatty acid metabolism transcriptional regulator